MKIFVFWNVTLALRFTVRKLDLVVAGRVATGKFFNSLVTPIPIVSWLDDLSEAWLGAACSWSLTQLIEMVKLASRLPPPQANLLAGPDIISLAFHSLHSRYGRLLDYRHLPLGYLRMTNGPGLVLMLPNFLRDRLITAATQDADLAWIRGLCEHGPHSRTSTFKAALSFGFCHHKLGLNNNPRIASLAFPGNPSSADQLKLLLLQSWYFFAAPYFPVASHSLRATGIYWINHWLPKWLKGRPGFESIRWLVDLFNARIEMRGIELKDVAKYIAALGDFGNLVSATERARYSLILYVIELTFGIDLPHRLSAVLASMQFDLAPIDLHHFLLYFQQQQRSANALLIRDHARTLPRFHRILQAGGHLLENVDWAFASRPQLLRIANRFRPSETWQQAALGFLNLLHSIVKSCHWKGSEFEPRLDPEGLWQLWWIIFQLRTLKVSIPVKPSMQFISSCPYQRQNLYRVAREYFRVESFTIADLFHYLF